MAEVDRAHDRVCLLPASGVNHDLHRNRTRTQRRAVGAPHAPGQATMKVWITHSDGRYFCHPWEGGDPTGIPVVEVPWYRMLQIKVTRWLDRKTNAYLIKLDNAWWDTQDR